MAHGRSDVIVFYQKWKKCGINHLKTWKKSKIDESESDKNEMVIFDE